MLPMVGRFGHTLWEAWAWPLKHFISIIKSKNKRKQQIKNILNSISTYLRLVITHKGLSNVYLEFPRLVLLHVFGLGNLVLISSSGTLAMSSTSGKKRCFLSYSVS